MKNTVKLSREITISLDDIDTAFRYQYEEKQLLPILSQDGTESLQMLSPYWQYAIRLKDGQLISASGEYEYERKEVVHNARFIKDIESIRRQIDFQKEIGAQAAEKELEELLEELRRFLED